jgi:uncharacterized protein (DUF2147 family)
MKRAIAISLSLALSTVAFAQDDTTAAGLWQTYKGGSPQSGPAEGRVKIYEENGVWYGKIAGSAEGADDSGNTEYCTKCPGEFKDKPVEGLRFMWGFTRNGDKYTGGHILDPNTGNTYNASMTLADNGQVLKMRGYMGISLFGQTETWTRIKEPAKPKTEVEKLEDKAQEAVKKAKEAF